MTTKGGKGEWTPGVEARRERSFGARSFTDTPAGERMAVTRRHVAQHRCAVWDCENETVAVDTGFGLVYPKLCEEHQ